MAIKIYKKDLLVGGAVVVVFLLLSWLMPVKRSEERRVGKECGS